MQNSLNWIASASRMVPNIQFCWPNAFVRYQYHNQAVTRLSSQDIRLSLLGDYENGSLPLDEQQLLYAPAPSCAVTKSYTHYEHTTSKFYIICPERQRQQSTALRIETVLFSRKLTQSGIQVNISSHSGWVTIRSTLYNPSQWFPYVSRSSGHPREAALIRRNGQPLVLCPSFGLPRSANSEQLNLCLIRVVWKG